ncbi:MAG: LuxR C-terminal-related transcriptional regulator [Gemmatimonadales bacterium]
MTRAIGLVLVEDIRLLRDGIAAMLRAQGLRVLAAVRSGEDVVRQILNCDARLVLVDSALSNHDGPRLVESVTRSAPDAKVVVMDVQPAQPDIVDFVRAGAVGFILRDASAADIVSTLRDVAGGLYVLPPKLAEVLFASVARQTPRSPREGGGTRLTQREWQIIDLIADGSSNKEISSRLNLSVHTVKSHVHSVLEKLTLHSRLQVAAYARTNRVADRTRSRSEALAR